MTADEQMKVLAEVTARLAALEAEREKDKAALAEAQRILAEKEEKENRRKRGEYFDEKTQQWVRDRKRVTTGCVYRGISGVDTIDPRPAALDVYLAGYSEASVRPQISITSFGAAALLELIKSGDLVEPLECLVADHTKLIEKEKEIEKVVGKRGGKRW